MDQEEVGTMTVEHLAKLINGQQEISVSGQIQINNLKIENVDLSNQEGGTTEIYVAEGKDSMAIDMANEAVETCQSLMRLDPMDELQCQKCGKRFADINTLKSHDTTHEESHNVECKFLCTVCGEKFDKANALSAHLVQHRNIKLHHCEVCGLVFPDDQALKEHAQVHSRQKLHPCQK